jgi:putative Ca2+/H+ antiporter (TMEM165/GDT1 family)
MSPVALFSSFFFAAAAAASYPAGWVCDLYSSCTISQMLGWAAVIMFLAYLVADRIEAQSKKTTQRQPGTRARLLIDRNLSEVKRRLALSKDRPSRGRASRELLMLPSPRSPRDATL